MSKTHQSRGRTSRKSTFRLPEYPCQAVHLHTKLSELVSGSGDPRSENFTPGGYLRDSLLSRYADPSPEGALLRKQRAIDKLRAAELKNAETNQRLSELDRNPPTKFVQAVFNRAKTVIAEILGEVDYSMFLQGGFSKGASTSRLRTSGGAASKFDGKGHVTLTAYPYAASLIELSPLWKEAFEAQYARSGRQQLNLVEGNVVFTVPKDNVIDRAAAKEPDLNMYLQKGVGQFVRRRLNLVGVDLNDQTVNQRLAKQGSITGELATLDLSAASDSVTTGLIQLLFPQSWTDLLFDLRSERGIFPGSEPNQLHTWEMLSSMGNGFTFEIETLVFFALCRSVAYVRGQRGTINVYGDDIIVPTPMVSGVRRVFRYAGFTLNTSKSFYTGLFRESCGKHYHAGVDVTPFYIRTPIVNSVRSIHFANKLREWCNVGGICDPTFFSLWEEGCKPIPKVLFSGTSLESILSLAVPEGRRNGKLTLSPVIKRRSRHASFSHYIFALSLKQYGVSPPSIEMCDVGDLYKYRANGDIGDVPVFPQEIP